MRRSTNWPPLSPRSVAVKSTRSSTAWALQCLVSTRFKGAIRPPQGVLEPAYMAIALPPGSPLKKPLDEALVGITASQEWRQIEDGCFGREP
jgi:hypothetical protein